MKILINEKLSEHKYKTPEGYLVCVDSILARTGKQTYRRNELFHDGDDTEIEVDRTPEEVFSEATLASFENKPVTVEHPDEDVNVNNYKEYAVGFVRDVKRGVADGQDVILGTLVITDAQTIEEIENGEHTDLSCGYDCDILDEDNPSQRNIRGNHVALCQQGRAGIAKIVDSVSDTINDAVWKYCGNDFGGEDIDDIQELQRKYGVRCLIKTNGIYLAGPRSSLQSLIQREYGPYYSQAQVSKWLSEIKNTNDSIKDTTYCVEFSENGQVFKTWIDAKDEKEAQELALHSNPKARIRNVYRDSVNDANRLPAKDRKFISNYLRMISTYTSRDVDIRDLLRPLSGHGYNWTIEKIDGWKWNQGEYAHKDYYVSIDGYDDRFLVTLYADPNQDWKVKEVNAYFTDSIKDRDITKAEEYKIAKELSSRFGQRFTTTGESGVEASEGIWPNSELDKKIVRYLKSKGYKVDWDHIGDDGCYYLTKDAISDSVNDSTYKCEFKVNGQSMWTYVKADSPEDAKRELLDKFANAKEISVTSHDGIDDSIIDSLQDAELVKLTNEPGRDKILAVYQSDIDENLYFYVGANYCMRDGEFTYNKYKTLGTPQQIMRELERNGWHKVNRGLAPFIDSINDSYNWKQLIEKHKDELIYSYETGGKKLPLKLSRDTATYDIEEEFNIKNYTEQDVREYQRAWEEFARKYRAKDSINDDSRGYEIVSYVESYLSELGKNNSIGKYDRVVQGVKSLLKNGWLQGEELKKAARQETDRLLKKYALDSAMKVVSIIKAKDSEIDNAKRILNNKGINVAKVTGSEAAFYLWLENKEQSKQALDILKQIYKDVNVYTDDKTKMKKIRIIGAGTDTTKIKNERKQNEYVSSDEAIKEIESILNKLKSQGWKIIQAKNYRTYYAIDIQAKRKSEKEAHEIIREFYNNPIINSIRDIRSNLKVYDLREGDGPNPWTKKLVGHGIKGNIAYKIK